MSGLIPIAFSLFNPGVLSFPPAAVTPNTLQQQTTIRRRHIVLVRSAEVARLFPKRKTAIISFPVITKLKPNVLKKVRVHFAFKNIFDYSLADQSPGQFLSLKKRITFLYDAGFPHVIKVLEPRGRYLFCYDRLTPFIRSDGPLGQFVR